MLWLRKLEQEKRKLVTRTIIISPKEELVVARLTTYRINDTFLEVHLEILNTPIDEEDDDT